jgi:hypothetical protein
MDKTAHIPCIQGVLAGYLKRKPYCLRLLIPKQWTAAIVIGSFAKVEKQCFCHA